MRNLLRRSVELMRQYKQNNNEADYAESLRLLGTATHCLEDYSAHSNYIELALIEIGERDVFPHVGRDTKVRVNDANQEIYPLVTGTFGGVDFLHSVCGEISDKATQSEIEELEGTVNDAQRSQNVSAIKKLLDDLPPGLFGSKDEKAKVDEIQANAAASQMQNMRISPKEPEEFTRQAEEITRQIYPVLEFHDEIMRTISNAIENIPILPEILEKLQEQLSVFCFSVIAPFILPIIGQIKAELSTGSSEIIQSSKNAQLIVFNDDRSSNPTHSMLSKDHFSNILNEPAGKIASQILKWSIPQIVQCYDDPNADAERNINRIINAVFHHPALRHTGDDGISDGKRGMYKVVEDWWNSKDSREKDDFRRKLSREGVRNGENHKEGVHDKGHGCGKPLGFAKVQGGHDNAIAGAMYGGLQEATQGTAFQDVLPGKYTGNQGNASAQAASQAVGGGILGALAGGIIGSATSGGGGGGFLSSVLGGGSKAETQQYSSDIADTVAQTGTYSQNTSLSQDGRPEVYGQSGYGSAQHFSGGRNDQYGSAGRNDQYGSGGRNDQYGSGGRNDQYGSGIGYSQNTSTQTYGRTEQSEGGYGGGR